MWLLKNHLLFIHFLVFLFGNYLVSTSDTILQAKKIPSILPRSVEGSCIIYNYDDLIYIFGGGGRQSWPSGSILKYSLGSSTVQQLSTTIPFPSYGMSVVSHSNGSMYIFGTSNGKGVVRFDPTVEEVTIVDIILNQDIRHTPVVKYNTTTDVVLFFRSESPEILQFDLDTLEQTEISLNLGKGRKPAWYSATHGFLLGQGRKAILFRAASSGLQQSLIKVDLTSFSSQLGPSNHLIRKDSSTVVYDGKSFAYGIGGFDSRSFQTNAIIQYNTTTMNHTYFPINNFLVSGSRFFIDAPSSVYVKRENRIYMFGGTSGTFLGLRQSWSFHREIYYIELNEIVESGDDQEALWDGYDSDENDGNIHGTYEASELKISITRKVIKSNKDEVVKESTSNIPAIEIIRCPSPNGIYQHPYNCSSFIGCDNNVPKVYACPEPYMFDADRTSCNLPELVDCVMSCSGRPNGAQHGHPLDCTKFYVCHEGLLQEYQCTSPLLYDVKRGQCYFKEFVKGCQ